MDQYLYCQRCGEVSEVEIREEKETYPVKNEQTEILASLTYCRQCGEQIWNESLDENNLKEAYRIYRLKHGLLQPEVIKRIREKYGLSQTSFGKLLGLGEKTIVRYENGSIQDSALNNLIELAGYPFVFALLVAKNKACLSDKEYQRVMHILMSDDACDPRECSHKRQIS